MDGGEAEGDVAVDPVLDRAGEDLAVGEVLGAVAVDPGPAGDAELQVGVGGDDVQFSLLAQQIDQALLPVADGPPRGHWVSLVEVAGAEDEILVLGQAHLGVLGERLGGELGAAPVEVAGGCPLHEGLHQRLARLLR